MLLQAVAVIDCVQLKVLSTSVAHKRHCKDRPLGLGKSEILSDPGVTCCAIACVTTLSDAVGKVLRLKEDHQFLRYILNVLVPIRSKKGGIASSVEPTKVVVFPGLRAIGGSLTLHKFVIERHVIYVLDLQDY